MNLGHEFQSQYITWIEELKKLLYNEETKTITFISNDLIDPQKLERFSLEIKEDKLTYEVIFHKPKESKHYCSIRFNTNRSEYGPLVRLFTNFYEDLTKFSECYQYSINDYIETKQTKQNRKTLVHSFK